MPKYSIEDVPEDLVTQIQDMLLGLLDSFKFTNLICRCGRPLHAIDLQNERCSECYAIISLEISNDPL